MPKTAVLVIHHEVEKLTKQAIKSLKAQNCPHDLYVIDAASSKRFARSKGVHVYRLRKSPGLAYAINEGMKRLENRGYDYVYHFTNDVICGEGTLLGLVAALESDPKLGAIQSAMPSSHPHLTPRDGGGCQSAIYLEWAAVLVRTVAWQEAGPLDEGFGMFSFDIDYSYRLRQKGWKLAVNYDVLCDHLFRGTHDAVGFDIGEQGRKEHEHGVQKYGREDWANWLKSGGDLG